MSWIFSALSFCCFEWLSLLPGVLLLMYFLIWIVKKYFCLSNKIYKCDMDCVIMFSWHTADETPSTLKPSYVSAVKAVQDKSALYRSINCQTKPHFGGFATVHQNNVYVIEVQTIRGSKFIGQLTDAWFHGQVKPVPSCFMTSEADSLKFIHTVEFNL